jgi:hypothetical protein
MNTKDAKKSEQTHIEPLDFIMNNPKMTPILLLILAAIPVVTAVVVLALVWHWQ